MVFSVFVAWFFFFFFFFNDTATTEIYTLSLHDALPICRPNGRTLSSADNAEARHEPKPSASRTVDRSEEHTSELQSRENLVCRLLLEKKKKNKISFLLIKKKKRINRKK